MARNELKALAYIELRSKLTKAFDKWVAAKPEHADACEMEYRALLDQMRQLTSDKVA